MKATIRLARHAGFCVGVQRAIKLTKEALARRRKIWCIGALIHNPQAVGELKKQGLQIVEDVEKIPEGAVAVVRSHGVHPEVLEVLRRKNVEVLDATCPLVKRVQEVARQLHREGYTVIIVGEREHPEVKAILGYAPGAFLLETEEKVSRIPEAKRFGVVAQTTQASGRYIKILKRLMEKDFQEMRIYNTICDATVRRERSAKEVADSVDVMFVLGGRMSANTRRLAETCRKGGSPAYHLEGAEDLQPSMIEGKHAIGVAAGTSTPESVIAEFTNALESLLKEAYDLESEVVGG